GLGMDSKYTIALAALSAVAFAIFDKPSRRWLLHPASLAAALLSVLLFSPVIIWNARNGWASFVFQGPRRWGASRIFSTHTLLLSIFLLLTPVGVIAAFFALRRWPGKTGDETPDDAESQRRRLRFVQIFTLLPLA